MSSGWSRRVAAALLVFAVGVIVAGALSVYRDGPGFPLGADTPQLVWRMRLVTQQGLDALPTFRDSHLLNANADRPGLPVFSALVAAVHGPDAIGLAFVLPGVAAAVIALAGASAAIRGAGAGPFAATLSAVAVGAAVPVAFAANGPLEQLFATALLVGAVAMLVPAARGNRAAAVGSVVLLAGAWTCHWIVTLTISVALAGGALAVWFLPLGEAGPAKDRRRSSFTILALLACGAAAGAAVFALSPGAPQSPLGVTQQGVSENVARQLPPYLASGAFPLAVVGVVVLWQRRGSARIGLTLLLAWAAIPVLGVLAAFSGRQIPLHRLLSSALSVQLLAAAGATGIARFVSGRHGSAVRNVLGGAFAAVLVTVLVVQAWHVWDTRQPATSAPVAAQMEAVGRALDGTDRPVILVVEDLPVPGGAAPELFGTVAALRRLRAVVPGNLIARTVVYLGDPDQLRRGRPTLRPELDGYDAVSLDAWRAVAPLLNQQPLILVLKPFATGFDEIARALPQWRAAPWLLASDPGLQVPATPPQTAAPALGSLAANAASTLALLVVVGLGWSLALGGRELLSALTLAPALGLAVLVTTGLAAGAVGANLGGSDGRNLVAALAATSLALAIVSVIRRRPVPGGAPVELSGARSG